MSNMDLKKKKTFQSLPVTVAVYKNGADPPDIPKGAVRF